MRYAPPVRATVTRIRRFSRSDAVFVGETGREAFSEYGSDAREHTLSLMAAPGATTLIAEHDDRPVGFAIVGVRGDVAHLHAIAVVTGMRGRGVGEALLRAAERNAMSRGGVEVRLETGEANLEAIDLFVRSGYRQERRVARYYRTGYDALIFAKRLDTPATR